MFLQRFGCALVNKGQLNLKQKIYETDLNPIDANCDCATCKNYTRAYLHCIVSVETVACHLISVHNIAFQVCFCLNHLIFLLSMTYLYTVFYSRCV